MVADTRPISAFHIPPGYRAVTIEVDRRTGVEGFAKPNSRVDVLWTYEDPKDRDRRKKVATIVHFSRVLSVGGVTSIEAANAAQGSANATTVTLLVTEQDAKKIELARTLGVLSLSLVGEQEQSAVAAAPEPIDIYTLLGRGPETEQAEEPSEGIMYTEDPKTGRQVKYLLRRGRWERAPGQ